MTLTPGQASSSNGDRATPVPTDTGAGTRPMPPHSSVGLDGQRSAAGRFPGAPAVTGLSGRSSTARTASPPEMKIRLKLVAVTDVAVLLSVLLPVFIVTNLGSMPEGIAEFLALRVTVRNLLLLFLFALAWRALSQVTGLYRWEAIRERRSEFLRIAVTCGLVSAVALVFPAISVTGAFRYEAVLYFWIGSTAGIFALRRLIGTLATGPEAAGPRTTVIVGTGPRGQHLFRELRSARPAAYHVIGFVDSDDRGGIETHAEVFLGGLEDLETILMRNAIDEVLVTLPIKSRYADIQSVLETCERVGVRAKFSADLFDTINGKAVHENGLPSLVTMPRSPQGWELISKRLIDLLGASLALLVLAPVLLPAMLLIKLTTPGPVIFKQERYGMNRRRFTMYKLRTMVCDAEALQSSLEERNEASGPVFKIRDDPRITPVGRLLRRFSIDELPQLVNVLYGQMSLVGPRPLPVRDVDRFTEAALMRRFSIRPGVTCLWQIGGRSNLGFDDWIRLDLKYIDEWTLMLDFMILLRTFPAVVRGIGAS